jgi:hypothetical protein
MTLHRPSQLLPLRTLAPALLGLGLTPLIGCASFLAGAGPQRSPQFASGNAPEPTVVTTVLSCVASDLRRGAGDTYTAQFNALARAAMPAEPVPLSHSTTSALCGTIAASDRFHAYREPPQASAMAVIREIAQATGAKAIVIPAMRLYARCERDTRTVHDSSGRTIATIDEGTETCSMDRFKDVGLYIFAADGSRMYSHTKRVGMASSTDPEPMMNEVLANIPAKVSAPAGAAFAAPAPAASPIIAAPAAGYAVTPAAYPPPPPPAPEGVRPGDPKVDAAIAEVNGKAPAECRKFLKRACNNAGLPDTHRLQMCTAYVQTVNQLVGQMGAKSADSCHSMAASVPQ